MIKLGIVGGGQLGRMLIQSALNYPCRMSVLESSADAPAADFCHEFQQGQLTNYDDVLSFCRKQDVVTIEIEHINTDALKQAVKEGIKVIPDPEVLELIKDKGTQKQHYAAHAIASSDFRLIESEDQQRNPFCGFPYVLKTRTFGYDGKGVQYIASEADLPAQIQAPCLMEEAISIKAELAVIIAIDQQKNEKVYPVVEMVANDELNLLDYAISPTNFADEIMAQAQELALKAVRSFQSAGLFAVELFLDSHDRLLVNEIAPRVHNSGHLTIEGNLTSQFDQLIRILLDLPLGSTELRSHALMYNLLGGTGFSGAAKVHGLKEVLQEEQIFLHLYGKTTTKPGRKMGHVTITADNREALLSKHKLIKNQIRIEA